MSTKTSKPLARAGRARNVTVVSSQKPARIKELRGWAARAA
jgi:hypothetical protein